MENTKKMDYTEFKEVLKKLVQEKAGTDMKVEIVQIIKNNQTRSENLTYIDPNYNLFPSIQLKELYQEYQKYGMNWCVEETVSVLGNMKKIHEDQLIGSWESAKERIIVELVKESWNQKLLEEIPYKPFLDLAVIYRIKMWECKSGDVVHTVTNEMMGHWDITEEFHEWMYIFTNRSRIKGATAMLRTDLLDRFAKAQESDLIILPSSVHEVLLLPAMDDEDVAELRRTVQDINEKKVKEEEWLSDEVYYFRRSTGAVELIPE